VQRELKSFPKVRNFKRGNYPLFRRCIVFLLSVFSFTDTCVTVKDENVLLNLCFVNIALEPFEISSIIMKFLWKQRMVISSDEFDNGCIPLHCGARVVS